MCFERKVRQAVTSAGHSGHFASELYQLLSQLAESSLTPRLFGQILWGIRPTPKASDLIAARARSEANDLQCL